MARTAPVPNIPPIPGMCPSIAVLAGGGAGGSGSGKGAGSGDGSGPGSGDGSADGAGGDGSNAGSCGNGQGCGCPLCQAGTAAGDPIDVVSGRAFTNPWTDLALRGPLPYAFTRSYSASSARRDGSLGYGWSHTLGWEVELRRDRIVVWRDDGTRARFPLLDAPGDSALGLDGWVLRRESWGYLLDCGDNLWRAFVSDARRPELHRLSAIQDRNGNRIALTYDDGRLVEVIDSAGRVLRVSTNSDGRITALDMKNAHARGKWERFATYEYDDKGDLRTAVDADGNARRYTYDEAHRLLSHSDPNGLTFYFVYDSEGRCVESWGAYPGKTDPSLADGLSPYLADGTTPAKGIMHVKLTFGADGYSEVADSTEVVRFFGNRFGKLDKVIRAGAVTSRTFDERGFVIAMSDALGAVTTWQRDVRGRALSMTNALNGVTRYRRDDAGNVISIENAAGHSVTMTRDARGNITTLVNQVGGVTSFRYDPRGLIECVVEPNGAATRLKHDEHGNLVEVTEWNGAIWRATYDFYGRRTSLTNPMGDTMRYEYSLGGLLTRYVAPDGAATSYVYDGAGHLTRAVDPDGTSIALEWGGYNARHEIKKPDGTSLRFRFDRDGRLREVHNERGEVHVREYETGGFLCFERTFDGREVRYKHDACGQLVKVTTGGRAQTEIVYDPLGRVVERNYSDGLSEKFDYNPTGALLRVRSGKTVTLFDRDPRGLVVAETQIVEDVAHTVQRSYDLAGLLTGRSTSLDHTLSIVRDTTGARAKDILDGALEVAYTRDAMGRVVTRGLGAGGSMDDVFDACNRVVERRVRRGDAVTTAVGDLEPAWIGPRPTAAVVEKRYRYSVQGDLIESWSLASGHATYGYDSLGQLLSFVPQRGAAESFKFDDVGNLREVGAGAPARRYQGTRLVERDGVEYAWDADGRLAAKVRKNPDGDEQRWSYHWSAKGTLEAVRRPDGSTVHFVYDAFFRRLGKRTVPPPGGKFGGSFTRFVWDEDALVHEIRATRDIVSERTYCFDGTVPVAQRDALVREGERERGPWYHYVNDPAGTPEELVDGTGAVAARVERAAWGRATVASAKTDTKIRFRGQYEDEETGLCYNRHRYYDPDAARYISADPLGLAGGTHPFAYVPNPLGYVDPMGLTTSAVTEQLAENMANDPVNPRPIGAQHQAHHIVPREHNRGAADSARQLLAAHDIDLDDPENGARLMGRTPSNVEAGGHQRGCAGYHGTRSDGTGSVHSKSAYDTVNRRLQEAAKRGGRSKARRKAEIQAELRKIGGEMENGSWMTDEDRANL